MTYVNKGTISPRYIVSSLGDGNYDDVDGTSDEDQINQAINDLTSGRTWPEKVLLKGNLVIDGPIVVPAYTHIENTGRVYLANSTNTNMLQNANPASNDVECVIEGGLWYGNRDNNAGPGDIIYWEHSANPASGDFKWTIFRNMQLIDAPVNGLVIDSIGSAESNWEISHVWGRFADNYSFWLNQCADFFMNGCQTEGDAGTLFQGSGIGVITNSYFNQTVQITGSGLIEMGTCHIDIGINGDGLSLASSRDCTFENIVIRATGSSGFVGNAAIYLTTTDRCSFRGIRAGLLGGGGTNRWNFIIEETNSCDDNEYKNIYPDDYVTAVADLQGTGQKLDFLSVPFVLNRGGATEADHGIDVSGGGEHAVAHVNLPYSVHQLVWLVIDAYIGAAPGAGDTMEIDLRINGASDNQPWGTHSTTLANLGSIGTNYLVGDVGYWRTRANDSAGVLALEGGDSVQIDVYHEVGSGEEADTDAEFRSATLWYV